jgi:putative holliday junction resolvase
MPVILWDERLSTVEATRRMDERRGRRRKGTARVDAEAAAVILETYLDHIRSKGKT